MAITYEEFKEKYLKNVLSLDDKKGRKRYKKITNFIDKKIILSGKLCKAENIRIIIPLKYWLTNNWDEFKVKIVDDYTKAGWDVYFESTLGSNTLCLNCKKLK